MLVHRFFVNAAHFAVRPGPQLNRLSLPATACKAKHVPVEKMEE